MESQCSSESRTLEVSWKDTTHCRNLGNLHPSIHLVFCAKQDLDYWWYYIQYSEFVRCNFIRGYPWSIARLRQAASTYVEHISPLVTEPSAYNWRDFPVNHYDLGNDIDGSVKSRKSKFILTPSCFWFKDVGTIEDHNEDVFYIWSRLICAYYDNFEFQQSEFGNSTQTLNIDSGPMSSYYVEYILYFCP